MEIESTLSRAKQYSFKDSLIENKMYLQSLVKDDINLPSILVKFVDKTDFEERWGEIGECGSFYDDFVNGLRNYTGNPNEDSKDPRDVYLQHLLQNKHSCKPIVAFVSDIDLMQYSDEIIISPGIYVKKKEDDDDNINSDFGILYSLIKAQIYYSMSRTDIPNLRKYKGIDSVIYSALTLKVMRDKDFENLIEHQIKSRRLAGCWAIPLDLLILSYRDKSDLDDILDDDIIRKVFFGEDIDERKWLQEIYKKVEYDVINEKSSKKIMESIFIKIVELLEQHPNLTESEIIDILPDFRDKARPISYLGNVIRKYNKGEIEHTNERPRRWKIS